MNCLLDCLVEDENDEICMFNFTNRYLPGRIFSDITWTIIEQSRVNTELVSLASALNGGKETMIITAENSKKIEVTYTTIAYTLRMHYPIEERKLKQLGDEYTLRRS
jgi:hypothetical protein